jgi:hypothetical protein
VAELIGEENIDWNDFTVTDPDAPEFEGETGVEEDQADPAAADTSEEDVALAPEETAEERPLETEAEQQERLYAGKYRTVEEMEAAFEHQQMLAGRQGTEVGELRQQLSELVEALNRPALPSLNNLDEVFAENPFLAAERTLQAQDWSAHDRVIRQWEEIDPAQVGLYRQNKMIEQQALQARQEVEAFRNQPAPTNYQSALQSAEQRLKQEFPDIDLQQLGPAMVEEANEAHRIAGDSVYAKLLESGDPEQTYMGLRTLALTAINRQSAEVRSKVAENARTAAAESQRAKTEAMVTSATGTAPEPAAPKTYDDELLEGFQQEDTRRDGFNIGPY